MLKNTTSLKIIVGMSGGVDSSVAAYLLKEAGHAVQGVFMKNWEQDDTDEHCAAAVDLNDAKNVCDRLLIPFHVINFADEYWRDVFEIFLAEYQAGRTPNPDILCNKEIKFKAFLNYALQSGADYIATGHYAKIESTANGPRLLKAADLQKDQSYFLHALSKDQLTKSLFPLGHLNKTEIRLIAKKIGLENHSKKDSTGICFIGERKFKHFLQSYLPNQAGNIESDTGEILGRHDGLMFYTIGQRQGLLIGGKKGKLEAPWYVAHKDLTRNVLIVVQGDHPLLYQKRLLANKLHWINHPPDPSKPLCAKTRYRQPDQPCMIESITSDQFQVSFAEPQRALTPGQSIVFYQDDICLGGGIIELN